MALIIHSILFAYFALTSHFAGGELFLFGILSVLLREGCSVFAMSYELPHSTMAFIGDSFYRRAPRFQSQPILKTTTPCSVSVPRIGAWLSKCSLDSYLIELVEIGTFIIVIFTFILDQII